MELGKCAEARSADCGEKAEEIGAEHFQLGEEIRTLVSAPPASGSSFTALLELPATQAVKLLHSPELEETPRAAELPPVFPACKLSVFLGAGNSPETGSIPVKQELTDSDSPPDNSLPLAADPMAVDGDRKLTKRKEREKKVVKGPAKKSKTAAACEADREKLPYVHARREKINARMKLLQELVPGCNKISGTAMVLDEIINHVQSLQRQVEFLSMRLAAVNPRIDINLDSLLAAENGSLLDSNFSGIIMPSMWPEGQFNVNRQQCPQVWHQTVWGREEGNPNFITPENSLLSYNSSANSASLHSNQLKMEL
ncbi:hypothetical protein RJ640_019519 [Escallonia rubra]|uniref:BHLH domain-containing protein n=1 Tax=Escallonia rubra TaxID=112253 RepID=A0AA88UIR0_9ASTE|nr:hypothetical protein RJ640_019519 [Escallonia rubra]